MLRPTIGTTVPLGSELDRFGNVYKSVQLKSCTLDLSWLINRLISLTTPPSSRASGSASISCDPNISSNLQLYYTDAHPPSTVDPVDGSETTISVNPYTGYPDQDPAHYGPARDTTLEPESGTETEASLTTTNSQESSYQVIDTMDHSTLSQIISASVSQGIADGLKAVNAGKTSNTTKNHAQAPEHYDGQRNNYETFRRGLELYVKAISGDSQKIYAAVSFMTKGDADSWAQNFVQYHGTSVDAGAWTWNAFLTELDKKFLDPRIAEHAREQLFKQRQHSQAADVFFLKFDELRVKGEMTDAAYDKILVEYLRKNMNPTLVLTVDSHFEGLKENRIAYLKDRLEDEQIDPVTHLERRQAIEDAQIKYDEFREYAIKRDPSVQRYRDDHNTNNFRKHVPTVPEHRRYQHPQPPSATVTTTVSAPPAPAPTFVKFNKEPDVVPMDVDVNRQRHRQERRCYRCNEVGHIARNCTASDRKNVIRKVSERYEEKNDDNKDDDDVDNEEQEGFPNPQ